MTEFLQNPSNDANAILKKIAEINANVPNPKPGQVVNLVNVSIDDEKGTVTTPTPPVVVDMSELKRIATRMGEIINYYGGESNIPVQKDHEYWGLLEDYRKIINERAKD